MPCGGQSSICLYRVPGRATKRYVVGLRRSSDRAAAVVAGFPLVPHGWPKPQRCSSRSQRPCLTPSMRSSLPVGWWAVFRDHRHAPGAGPWNCCVLIRWLTTGCGALPALLRVRRHQTLCGTGRMGPAADRPSLDGFAVVVDAMATVGLRRWCCRWVRRRSRRRGSGPGRVGVWCRFGAPGGVGRRTCTAGPRSSGRWSARRRGPAGRAAAGRGR